MANLELTAQERALLIAALKNRNTAALDYKQKDPPEPGLELKAVVAWATAHGQDVDEVGRIYIERKLSTPLRHFPLEITEPTSPPRRVG